MYTVKVTYWQQPDATELWGSFKTREEANVFTSSIPLGPGKRVSVEKYSNASELAKLAI
jgi:hypothetical protein